MNTKNMVKKPGFRLMNDRDLEGVMKIEQQVFPFPWIAASFQNHLNKKNRCWIYGTEEEIHAYGVIFMEGDKGHILNLCVRPEFQRQGLGHLMLNHLLEVARQHKVQRVLLEVRVSNEPALRLYRGMGFKEVEISKSYYLKENGHEDALVMEKALIEQE
ncbi:MAG: ribosomal protein S18-alanine N-acetyltransferase [Candidatus Hodarchaeota archaeon]